VLADDNFASIAAAVEEGRRVYDNLVKALAFVLPTNLGLALIMIAAVGLFPIVEGRPLLPMAPVQVLWINLVAAVALALPLALEAMEPGVMARPPRRPDAPVLDRFILGRTVLVALLMTAAAIAVFLLADPDPVSQSAAQTQAVTTVVLFQILYLLDCRSFERPFFQAGLWSNPWLYAGIGVVLGLQFVFVYAPFMHVVFGSAPLSAREWGEALLAAAPILIVMAVEKRWRRRAEPGPS
jgi:magnesium-transporting ATPase (P-type)